MEKRRRRRESEGGMRRQRRSGRRKGERGVEEKLEEEEEEDGEEEGEKVEEEEEEQKEEEEAVAVRLDQHLDPLQDFSRAQQPSAAPRWPSDKKGSRSRCLFSPLLARLARSSTSRASAPAHSPMRLW